MNAPMKPYICPPSSSAKITSSGLMRSAWPNTLGATTWPSICCSAVNMIDSHSASSGSPQNSAITRGGKAPTAGPDVRDQLGEAVEGAERERVRLAVGEDPERAQDVERHSRARAHDHREQQ